MSDRKLKTIDEHNAEVLRLRREREAARRRTGVACPKCGGELLWSPEGGGIVLTSFPPRSIRTASCQPCGISVDLEV